MRRLVWCLGKEEDQWIVYGFTSVHFGDFPAGPFLELTKKKANELERPICQETADQMEKGYVDDGNGRGSEEMGERMIGSTCTISSV